MQEDIIKLSENFKLLTRYGSPVTLEGKLTSSPLAGIDLDFTLYQSANIDELQRLASEEITVEDPFVKRTYQANLRIASYRYTDGKPGTNYVVEVREVEKVPVIDTLEIEGQPFQVLKYDAKVLFDEVEHTAILKLTKAELEQVRNLTQQGEENPAPTLIKRIGVDASAIPYTCFCWVWSEHIEADETYYKQVFQFTLPKQELNKKDTSGLAFGLLVSMSTDTKARFEALLNELTNSGVISSEKRDTLLNNHVKDLINEERLIEIKRSRTKLSDVEDEY